MYNAFCCNPLATLAGYSPVTGETTVENVTVNSMAGEGHLVHQPVSFFGATAEIWRNMMGVHQGDAKKGNAVGLAVEDALVRELGEQKATTELGHSARHDDMDMWHLDQRML